MADEVDEDDFTTPGTPGYDTAEGAEYRAKLRIRGKGGFELPSRAEGYAQAVRESSPLRRGLEYGSVGLSDALSRASFGLIPRDFAMGGFGASDEERAMAYEGAERATSTDDDGTPNYLGQAIRYTAGSATDYLGLVGTRGAIGAVGGVKKLGEAGKVFRAIGESKTALGTGAGIGAVAGLQSAVEPEVSRGLYDDPYADPRGVGERTLTSALAGGLGAGLGTKIAPAGASFGRQMAGGAVVDTAMGTGQALAQGEDSIQDALAMGLASAAGGAGINAVAAKMAGRARTFAPDAEEASPTVRDAELMPEGEESGPITDPSRLLEDRGEAIRLPDRQNPKPLGLPGPTENTPSAEVMQHAVDLAAAARIRRQNLLTEGIPKAEAEHRAEMEKQEATLKGEAQRQAEAKARSEAQMVQAAQSEIAGAHARAKKAKERLEVALKGGQDPSSSTWNRVRNAVGGIAGLDKSKPLTESVRDYYGKMSRAFRQYGQEAETGGLSNVQKAARKVAAQDSYRRADSIAEQGEKVAVMIDELSALDNPSLMSTFLGQRVGMVVPNGETVPIALTELGKLPSDKKLTDYGMFAIDAKGYGKVIVNGEAAREMVEAGPRLSEIARRLKADPATPKGFEAILNEAAMMPDISMSKIMAMIQGYGAGGFIDLRDATHIALGTRNHQQTNAILTNNPGESEWILRTRHNSDSVELLDATPDNLQRVFQDRVNAITDPKLRAHWQSEIDGIGSTARAEKDRQENGPRASSAHVEAMRTVEERVNEASDDVRDALLTSEVDPEVAIDWNARARELAAVKDDQDRLRETLLPEAEAVDPEQAAFLKAKLDQQAKDIDTLSSNVAEEQRRTEAALARLQGKGKARKDYAGPRASEGEAQEGELAGVRPLEQPGIYGPRVQALVDEAAATGVVPKRLLSNLKRATAAAARDPERKAEWEQFFEDADFTRRPGESIDELVVRINRAKDTATQELLRTTRLAEKAYEPKRIRQLNAESAATDAIMRAANTQITEINKRFPPGVQFRYSGIPIPPAAQKAFDEKVVPWVKSNLRAFVTGLTDRAESRAQLRDIGEKTRVGLAELLERQAVRSGNPHVWRQVSHFLNLPPTQKFVREFDKQRVADKQKVTALKSQFEFKLEQLSQGEREDFWKSAETGDKNRTAPILHGHLDAYHRFCAAVAHEMVVAGHLDADTAANLRGKYVGHFGGKNTEQLRTNARLNPGSTEMEQRLARKLEESFAKAQRAAPKGASGREGIGSVADESRAFVDRHTRSRTPLTPEEMEHLGYLKGALPILKTIEQEGTIWANFKFLRNVKEHPDSRQYWMTAEDAAAKGLVDGHGNVINKNWQKAEHKGFGVFTGHLVHDSLYTHLSMATPEARNGWYHLAQQVSGMSREGVTSQSGLGYQVATALIDNPFHAIAAGLSASRMVPRQVEFWKDFAEMQRSGKVSETMKALIDTGHYKVGQHVLFADEHANESGLTDYRDVQSKGGAYLKDFAQRTADIWALAGAVRGKKSRGTGIVPWMVGDLVKTWRAVAKGFDPARAAGKPMGGGPGMMKNAKLSGEGLVDLQSMIDLSYKYSVYKDLREHGGNGLTQKAIRATVGKPGPARGMTHDEAAQVLNDWYGFEQQPTIIKGISSIPGLFAFARIPLIKAWNFAGRGYMFDNPLGTALNVSAAWMAGMAGKAMIQSVYGYDDEQIEQMKLTAADGDQERADALVPTMVSSDHNGDPTIVFTDWSRTQDVQYLQKLANPASFASPRAGEPASRRMIRGVAASDPTLSGMYETATGINPRSGADTEHFEPPSLAERIAGGAKSLAVPFAGDVSNLMRSSGQDKKAEAEGREPYSSNTERVVRTASKLPTREISVPDSKRGRDQEGRADKRKVARENATNEDLEYSTHTDLQKPKLPKNPTKEEIETWRKKYRAYQEAQAKRRAVSR